MKSVRYFQSLGTTLFLVASPLLGLQPINTKLKPHSLKSGRVVFPVMAGPMIAPNMPKEKMYCLSYMTSIHIGNTTLLKAEAEEYWEELRPNFEKIPGITSALLQAEEMHSGVGVEKYTTYRFVIERRSDGSWKWLTDEPKSILEKKF